MDQERKYVDNDKYERDEHGNNKTGTDDNVNNVTTANMSAVPNHVVGKHGEVLTNTCASNEYKTNEEIVEEVDTDASSDDSLLDCQDERCQTTQRSNDIQDESEENAKLCSTADYFCTSCDLLLCTSCHFKYHQDHQLSLISEARKAKEKYLDELLNGVNKSTIKCQTQKLQLENLMTYFTGNVKDLMLRIESRAAKLCEQIQRRKQQLLDELRSLKKYHLTQYENQLETVKSQKEELLEASDFASTLLSHGEDSDVLTIGREVSDNLHKLIKNRGLNGVNISSIKLDIPDQTRDVVHVDKLFGSLVQGIVRCGEADQIASYNIDLPWPTGMAVTRNHDFVVTGKSGALDEKGKVLFINKQGKVQNIDSLEDGCIPYGVCIDHKSGDVLVSDSAHQIITYSPLGRKKEVKREIFRGTGRVSVSPSSGQLLVTSSDDHKVFLYDQKGRKYSIPTDDTQLEYPHYIATSEDGDVIVSDFKQNAVLTFDSGGKLRFKYLGNGAEGGQLKCPSAVCCDTFGNTLVADFMNDRVHLVSATGEFLGFLLTKENGITCPNFMTLDHDNNLYVGQYGGEITVFRYLSFVKYI